MSNKKQYYLLDDLGFVGNQDKISDAQIKKDIEMTIRYIKNNKSKKVISLPKKPKTQLAKAK